MRVRERKSLENEDLRKEFIQAEEYSRKESIRESELLGRGPS